MIIKTVAEIKVTDTIVVRGEKFLVDSISDKNNIPNIIKDDVRHIFGRWEKTNKMDCLAYHSENLMEIYV